MQTTVSHECFHPGMTWDWFTLELVVDTIITGIVYMNGSCLIQAVLSASVISEKKTL